MKRESLLHSPGLSKLTVLKEVDTGDRPGLERGRDPDQEEGLKSLKNKYEAYARDVVRGKTPTPEQQAVLDGIADRILSLEE